MFIYSKKKAKERNGKEKSLQDEFRKIKEEFEATPTESNATLYNAVQEELETFYKEKTKGIMIYFLNLEKRNHIKKHIRKLYMSGGIKTDPFKILKEQERFYRHLYKSNNTDPDITLKILSFLNNLDIPKLSEEQKTFCEGKISSEECFGLLDSFHHNKTPGNDGIPIEFYSVEWEFLLKCLEIFNFGPDFLRWVRVFYKNIQSCVINNGMTSNFFTLE